MADWKEEILKKWSRNQIRPVMITDEVRDRLAREFKGEVFYQEPMRAHTSIRVGGVADVFLKPKDRDDLKSILKIAGEEDIPCFILGAGSNTLVKDGGLRGFVIHQQTALKQLSIISQAPDTKDVYAEAGVGITAFVNYCAEAGLTGMEALVGIPGSIGGAVVMNAGSRGTEVQDIIREVTLLNLSGEFQTIPREKLEFSYRHLKLPKKYLVVSAVFRLHKGETPSIMEKIREFQKLRAQTQPLNFPNLGSIFKNPGQSKKGKKPIHAAELIEDAGLKNIRVGGARISEKHANFIVNERNASSKDVLVLINLVRDKVRESTGILLETEIKIVGED